MGDCLLGHRVHDGLAIGAENWLPVRVHFRRVLRFHPEAVQRAEFDLKKVVGGLLVQTPDLSIEDPRQGRVVTKRAPTAAEMRALTLGIRVAKHVKSNAIAFVAEDRTLAIGGGATSRIDPVYAAREYRR